MIVKKIPNPKKAASKAVRITALTEYVRDPEGSSATEKCVYFGARGFVTDTPAAQTTEMLALAEDAVRSPDPVTHYVLSWREGERPTPAQVEEAIDILLDEMQVPDHQVIYGVHDDTDNRHVHVVINRVHPDTLKVIKINNGFDIEAAHRAGVRIEQAQGWTVETRKRYKVREDGTLERTDPDAGAKARRPSQTQLDRERRTGEKSAARSAIEIAAPIVAKARSWDELHTVLAGRGMRYGRAERARTGATLSIGDVTIKASRVSRAATLRSLEARLGPYRPADPSLERPVEPKDAAPLIAAASSWEELHAVLAEQGLRYETVGSGARVAAGAVEARASAVSRDASLIRLEQRFGPYQPAEMPEPAHEPSARPVPPSNDPKAAAPVIAAAASWSDLHAALAERGMRYERRGSGAHIIAGHTVVKASTVGRLASLGALQKRLGVFESATGALPRREAQPLDSEMPRVDEYRKARDAYRIERDAHWLTCETRLEKELAALREKQEQERADVFRERDWHGLGLVLNAMRSVLAHEHAQEKAALRDKRCRAREEYRRLYPPWPSFEQWLLEQDAPDLAHRWRYQGQPFASLEGGGESRAVARDIRGYEAQIDGDRVLYRRKDAPRSRIAFADVGRRVNVYDWRSDESTLAALQLSAQKWGQFVVTGSDEFKERCVRLAARHGLRITNPELQDHIATERARLQAEQEEAAERARAAQRAATRDEQVILDVARASGPDAERRTLQPPAPQYHPSEQPPEEAIEVTRYGGDAIRLAEEVERVKREHGELRLGIDLRARHGSRVDFFFVDAGGNRCYSGHESMDTLAAMRALMKNRPPDEIPEIKRTLEREIAMELERMRARRR